MDRASLCTALALHAGKPLDQDTARAIVRILFPGRPIDVSRFARHVLGRFTIQCEPFDQVLSQLRVLHEAHWQETEGHRHAIGLNVDERGMRAMDDCGRLLQVTLRVTETGELAGHLRMYLHRSLHTRTEYAEEDCIYIAPQHRDGTMAGVAMGRYMEACVLQLGVREVRFTTKHSKAAAAAMLRRLRYQQVATQWVKILSEGEGDVL